MIAIPFTLALSLGFAGRSYLRSTYQGAPEFWQRKHLKRSLFFFGGALAASCAALLMTVVAAVR